MLAACTADREREVTGNGGATGGAAVEITAEDVSFLRRAGSSGYVYLLLGHDEFLTNLYEYDVTAGTLRPLTTYRSQFGISTFGASRAGIVVADASEEGFDVIRAFRGGDLVTVEPPLGYSPAINPRGDLLRTTLRNERDGTVSIDVRSAGQTRWRQVFRGRRLSAAVWLDDDKFMFSTVSYGPGRARLLEIDVGSGRVRQRFMLDRGPVSLLTNPLPGRQPPTVWAQGRAPSGFLEPGRIVDLPAGWVPKC